MVTLEANTTADRLRPTLHIRKNLMQKFCFFFTITDIIIEEYSYFQFE